MEALACARCFRLPHRRLNFHFDFHLKSAFAVYFLIPLWDVILFLSSSKCIEISTRLCSISKLTMDDWPQKMSPTVKLEVPNERLYNRAKPKSRTAELSLDCT